MEKILRCLFGASAIGIATIDEKLRFVNVNDALAAMNGFSRAAHIGKHLREILGRGATAFEPAINSVLSSGESVMNLEVSATLQTRKERGHWIENYLPIIGADGKRRVGAVVIEITKLRNLQEWLLKNPLDVDCGQSWDGLLEILERCMRELCEGLSKIASVSLSEQNPLPLSCPLTPRETETVRLLACGKGNKEIAAALNLSTKTVEIYRQRSMLKLNLHSTVDLVRYAIRNNLVRL